MSKNRLMISSAVLIVASALLPLFNITLPFGNPNLGSTPATLAGLYLPWPVAMICGVVKAFSASLATGRWLVEFPSGIGDGLMGLFTYWAVRHVGFKPVAGVISQLSRYVFTSGVIALSVSLLVATGMVPIAQVMVAGVSGAFLTDVVNVWRAISYPAITISIAFNLAAVLLVVFVFGKWIDGTSSPRQPAH